MLETYVVYIIKFAALTLVALRISWFLIEDEVPFGPIRVRLNVWATRRSWPRLALFLASDEARMITGQDHVIDGGRT